MRKLRGAAPKAAGITLLAFLLSWLLAKPVAFTVSSLFSAPEKDEYTIGDFYAGIADNRPIRSVEDRLVIVDIGTMGRQDIAGVLELVSFAGARTVGVDVMFALPTENDSTLLNALAVNRGNMVLPVMLAQTDKKSDLFEVSQVPFFYNTLEGMDYGAANLPTKTPNGTVREFATWFELADGAEYPSFPEAVVAKAYPDKAATLKARGTRLETIDYPSRDFFVIPAAELADRIDELTDKIVLIGSLNDITDMHAAPVSSYLSGVYIHAQSIATILNERYYALSTPTVNWLLAGVLSYIVALIGLMCSPKVKGLVNRSLQIFLVYTVTQVGYSLYIHNLTIVNFAYALMMLAFVLLAADLWNGTEGLVKSISLKMRKKNKKN